MKPWTARQPLPALPVTVLRDEVARVVVRTSLRRAAREISISPNGLRNFINGAAARPATCLKLERWIATHATKTPSPSVGRFVRLLNEVASDLTPQQATALSQDIAGLLLAAYESRSLTPPKWVTEFARQAEPRRARLRSASA